MSAIKVKLVRSRAGRSHDQLAILDGLGLRKMNQVRLLPDTPATIGMCVKVQHMVEWEKVESDVPAT